ncbi:MAG: CBS domain-containing protein [Sphingomonadales bacterium CG12_big_fil_rev_8_21_14_0_65_65_10]|nr:MAG: CBS domain-containing protein [Sphingomonadales bacterium CG12_big_fil_rev_8_21_14_0_65_65_10]
MNVSEFMTSNPACCGPSDTMKSAAVLMVDNDCGEIPVVDEDGCLLGVVTDRDIACRGVAEGVAPDASVSEVMSDGIITVKPDESMESCCTKMEENQVRRLPVVDEKGKCCGMVAQADIAQTANEGATGELVREVSV